MLNDIFHWNLQFCNLVKSWLRLDTILVRLCATENSNVSSPSNCISENKLGGKSIIQTRRNKEPNTDPFGTLISLGSKFKHRLFRTTCCDLSLRNGAIT